MNPIIKKEQYLDETIQLRQSLEEGFIVLGERLLKIRSEELWQGQYGSYAEFLEDMRMSEAQASKLVSVYEHYVIKLGMKRETLAPMPWSTLYAAIPLATSKSKVDDLMIKRRQDVEDEVRSSGREACKKHDFYTIRICKQCGYREKVYDGAG